MIPVNRRLTINVPPEVPAGKTILIFKPVGNTSPCMTAQAAMDRSLGLGTDPRIDPMEAIKCCSGITKRLGLTLSSDDFLAMSHQDKEFEDTLDGLNKKWQG